MAEVIEKTPEILETERLARLNGLAKGPNKIFQATVVRLGDDNQWYIMNKQETGWSSSGIPFKSLPSVARAYSLEFVRFDRDAHSFYVEVRPFSATISDEKATLIGQILENSVYLDDSGLVQNLNKALWKLSKNDLEALKLIIDAKVADAEGDF